MKIWVRVFVALTLAFLFAFVFFRRPADPVFEGRLVSQWAYDLLSSDYTIRTEAQTALKALGEPAVPQLRALLQKSNGPWEKPLVRLNQLLPFINYRSVDANLCRARSAEMIAMLGTKAQTAVPELVASLAHSQSASESERALVGIGAASVPALTRAMRDGKSTVRERAARLLWEFSPLNEDALAALVHATGDQTPGVRQEAAHSLGRTALRFPRALPALRNLAEDQIDSVRAAALQALGRIGGAVPENLALLNHSLRDRSFVVKLAAAKALWHLRQDPVVIVPVLTQILASRERWQAAYALGEMGPCAAAAGPALAQLLQEERVPRPFRTPPSSSFALGKIGRAAIPHLIPLLAHADSRVRISALLAFGFMGKDGREAVSQVAALLEDQDEEVRHTAAITLASVGAEPSRILAGLSDCLQAEDIYMRSAAAAILRDIAPDSDWIIQPE